MWGSRLIEASAGTGKTWTIAALYLRCVLGQGGLEGPLAKPLHPKEILVMTFTRAATRELGERIRARLVEAAAFLRQPDSSKTDDPVLEELDTDFAEPQARAEAIRRLNAAAQAMDEASIFTIDAWCQRVLREQAFDSGAAFDETLLSDEKALLNEAVQDYWRSAFYGLSPRSGLLAFCLDTWPTVEACAKDVGELLRFEAPSEEVNVGFERSLQEHLEAEFPAPLAALMSQAPAQVAEMKSWLTAQLAEHPTHWSKTKVAVDSVKKWFEILQPWSNLSRPLALPKDKAMQTGLKRLTPPGLLDGRVKAAPDFLPPSAFTWFEQVQAQYSAWESNPSNSPNALIRQHATRRVAQRMAQLKQQAGLFGFADLLRRLEQALRQSPALREHLVRQFPVAMVDEFQDTSPLQYRLFDHIYRIQDNAPNSAFLMIGDPKQSIYGFRGADIYSYLQARSATQGRHYRLERNFRSTEAMVKAVNQLFERAEQALPEGAFGLLPFVPVAAQGRDEAWVNEPGTLPAITCVADLNLKTQNEVRASMAELAAEQMVDWLNDARNGFLKGSQWRRLRPKDIAVLVRSGVEAQAVRQAMRKRGLASVYLSDRESVFESEEARDLVHWLRAVAEPRDNRLVRAGLALKLIDLSPTELLTLADDDAVFDRYASKVQDLHSIWQSQGVMAMLRQTLHGFELPSRWTTQTGGERRLTNFLHLAELLQTASQAIEGEHALIRWLKEEMTVDEGPTSLEADAAVLRLESDDDLVKVVTIHKSKGLEYPVVFLPFATPLKALNKTRVKSAFLPNAAGHRECVLDLEDEQNQQRFEQERLREDLRLLYVALTRAQHGLWLGFSAVKLGTSSADQTHRSALGYLLAPQVDWAQSLNDWAEAAGPDGFVWANKTADLEPGAALPLTRLQEAQADQAGLTSLNSIKTTESLAESFDYQGEFDKTWSVASYSRLTRELHPSARAQPLRPADDELRPSASRSPLLLSESRDFLGNDSKPAEAIQHRFKKGPLSGNFLHDQLEWMGSEGFGRFSMPLLKQRCERAGHTDPAADLATWLQTVANTPLPGPGVALSGLSGLTEAEHHNDPTPISPLTELEFWLPTEHIDTEAVDGWCQHHFWPGAPRPALRRSVLHGMLMGFMDLVFEHQGRFWVLDYKSNFLGNDDSAYHPEALQQAMLDHRYDVQAAVYSLALHRLLKSRLGAAYDPEKHWGGAIYYFIRGVTSPDHGVTVLRPPSGAWASLEALV